MTGRQSKRWNEIQREIIFLLVLPSHFGKRSSETHATIEKMTR